MPACSECGAHVTKDFIRVFGADGEVHGCLECMSGTDVKTGAARSPDATGRTRL